MNVRATTLLKGLGILLIIGHNFQYLASELPGVNEFVFDRQNVTAFLGLLTPTSWPRLSLAYFGHYGVQLFIFLSAYGLTRSFEQKTPKWAGFVKGRLARLYPAFVLAIAGWVLWKGRGAPLELLSEHGRAVAWKLSLASNLVRGEQLSLVGPWWFLPFIFQFYLLFPLLLRLRTRGLVVVALTALGLTVLLNETVLPGGFVYATPLGHLPEFCVGLWWARTKEPRLSPWLSPLALAIFAAGNWWSSAWYLSHLSVLVLVLAAVPVVLEVCERFGPLGQLLEAFGGLSMELFLVNGFLRAPFFTFAKQGGTELSAIGWGLISFGVCVLFALAIRFLSRRASFDRAGLIN